MRGRRTPQRGMIPSRRSMTNLPIHRVPQSNARDSLEDQRSALKQSAVLIDQTSAFHHSQSGHSYHMLTATNLQHVTLAVMTTQLNSDDFALEII